MFKQNLVSLFNFKRFSISEPQAYLFKGETGKQISLPVFTTIPLRSCFGNYTLHTLYFYVFTYFSFYLYFLFMRLNNSHHSHYPFSQSSSYSTFFKTLRTFAQPALCIFFMSWKRGLIKKQSLKE